MGRKGKLRKGDYVWVADDDLLYTPAKVLSSFRRGESTQVECVETGRSVNLSGQETQTILKMDKKTLNDFNDLTELTELTEESILYSLRRRFQENSIYTRIGPILVSVNPFKQLPYYTQDTIDAFMTGQYTTNNTPHVYGTADRCYSQMLLNKMNQSCVVTGESGAGKTEATKLILQYLTEKSASREMSSREQGSSLQKKILEMNPLLEGFGNARTGRNDNSSRFGKLTQLFFDKSKGTIVGVGTTDYLLEKSRIVQQQEGERNYHVFYQLLTDQEATRDLDLSYPENYYYLTQTGSAEDCVVKSINDAQDWKDTLKSMETLGISGDEQKNILKVLGGILHLGNVQFQSDSSDWAVIKGGEASVSKAASFLGFDDKKLVNGLLKTEIVTRMDSTFRNHTPRQAADARDALAKSLYSAVFDFLISKINQVLNSDGNANLLAINVLDIFGFEQFLVNSFEQLCINYCNEKLQVHFIDNVFKIEEQAYKEEGINVPSIDFVDNSEVLDIIENKATGLYSILDEQNKLPNGSNSMFLKKVLSQTKDYNNLKAPDRKEVRKHEFMEDNFNIVHFAGEVSYNVTNFIEKNSDKLLVSLESVAKSTSNPFVQTLHQGHMGAGNTKSLGFKFKNQLRDLLQVLQLSDPHFIRTIKPNAAKVQDVFTSEMVLQQVKCAGLLGVCEVHKNGFPVRFEFDDFVAKYNMIVHNQARDAHQLCSLLEQEQVLVAGEWQIGRSKVFMRNVVYEELENAREDYLVVYVIKIQQVARGYLVRKKVNRVRVVARQLEDAINERDEAVLVKLVAESQFLPKIGSFNYILSDAKQVLEEIEYANSALKDLKVAVENRDGNLVQSLINNLEEMNLDRIRNKSVIYEANELLEMLNNGEDDEEISYSFQQGDINNFMALMWEKMGSSFGISQKDIGQLTSLIQQLNEGRLDVPDPEIAVEKAENLYEYSQLQLEIQEFIRDALIEKDDQSITDALVLVQQFRLQTNDARRVMNLALMNNERLQDQAVSMRLNPGKLSMRAGALSMRQRQMQGPGMGDNRMSAALNMSVRLNNFDTTQNGGGFNGMSARISARMAGNVGFQKIIAGREQLLKQMDQNGKYDLGQFYALRSPEDFFESVDADSVSTEAMLTWTGNQMPKSLTQLNTDLNKTAMQVNKSILQYVGDLSFSFPASAAQNVIQVGIDEPLLRDEIYLQIIKNLTSNKRPTSEDRSWTLLILVTQQFPPTSVLEPFIISYLLDLKDSPLLLGNHANLCIAQLDRTAELGASEFAPSTDVIAAYSERPAVLLSVETCQKQSSALEPMKVEVPVYPETDTAEVVSIVCQIAGIPPDQADSHGLFVVGNKLKLKSSIVSRLEAFYKKHDETKLKHVEYFAAMYANKEEEFFRELVKRYGPEPPGGRTATVNYAAASETKEDVTSDRLLHPLPFWSFPSDIYSDLTFQGKMPHFYLKKKLLYPSDTATPALVEQLRQLVSTGELAITDYEKVIQLAAIALNMKNGGALTGTTEIMSLGMDHILPQIWLTAQAPKLTASSIFEASAEYSNFRPKDLLSEFVGICKESTGFGVWFYPVQGVTISSNSDARSVELEFLGVNHAGINLFDETRTEIWQTYTYEEIDNYEAENGRIVFNLRASAEMLATEVTFTTDLAWEIYANVQAYIENAGAQGGRMSRMPSTSFNRNSVMRTARY